MVHRFRLFFAVMALMLAGPLAAHEKCPIKLNDDMVALLTQADIAGFTQALAHHDALCRCEKEALEQVFESCVDNKQWQKKIAREALWAFRWRESKSIYALGINGAALCGTLIVINVAETIPHKILAGGVMGFVTMPVCKDTITRIQKEYGRQRIYARRRLQKEVADIVWNHPHTPCEKKHKSNTRKKR